MNILVLNGSPRKNGNTSKHVEAFAEGARSVGHTVDIVQVGTMNISGCKGCMYCKGEGNGTCSQNDDMQKVYPFWKSADMIVLATPVYFWNVTGQMLSTITRTFAVGKPHAAKFAMLLSSGSPDVYNAPTEWYKMLLNRFSGEDMGIKTVHGDDNASPEVLEQMRRFGASL